MESAANFFGKESIKAEKELSKTEAKIKEMEKSYFENSSLYGNLIQGYDFTVRGKKRREAIQDEVFIRKDVFSIFQLVPPEEQITKKL